MPSKYKSRTIPKPARTTRPSSVGGRLTSNVTVGGRVTSRNTGPFKLDVRLNPNRVRDLRSNPRSPAEEVAVRVIGGLQQMRMNLGRMIGGRATMLEGVQALRRTGQRSRMIDANRRRRLRLRTGGHQR